MKKILVTLTATLVCVGAFAQGKIAFENDSLHLYYYSTDGNLRPADAGLAGTGASSANMPAGVTLVVDLYGGTSSSSLALVSTTTFQAVPGRQNLSNVTVPGVASGTGFFQVQVRDNAFPTADAAAAALSYSGKSIIFTTVVGTSLAYNSIRNHNSPASSTWTDGSFDGSQIAGAGARGALSIGVVPEPTSFALCGLGAAALLIFRRRK